MTSRLIRQPLNILSDDWSGLDNYVPELKASILNFNIENEESEKFIACVRLDKEGKLHFNIPEACIHPLYIFEHDNKVYISDQVASFYHLGNNNLDQHFLGQLALIGCTLEGGTLLQDVSCLQMGEQFCCHHRDLEWLSIEVDNGENDFLKSRHPFDQIPKISLHLFSPIENSFYLDAYLYFVKSSQSTVDINLTEIRSMLQVDDQDFYKVMGPIGKTEIFRIKDKVEAIKTRWEKISGKYSFNDYFWAKYQLPFVKTQLTVMAYRNNKIINWTNEHGSTLPWKGKVPFQEQDRPIHNLFEAFQRLFYYGNKWLVKKWLFIPPLISSKLVVKRKGNTHRTFLYATSLDYLMRFHKLNHDVPME